MRVVFFGTPEFAVPSLRALLDSHHEIVAVVAQPDRPAGRGLQIQAPPVAEIARSLGLTLLQPASIRDPAFLDSLARLEPDLGVVIAYGKILPRALLQIPKDGFINVHGSLLPKYRGAAPIQRAIANGEAETGITVMRVDEQMDHGPILSAASTPIGSDERAPSVSRRLAGLGAARLIEVIDAIDRGAMVEVEQAHDQATYAPKIEKEEGRVDWSSSAVDIFNCFRAFDPWPGVYAFIRDEPVKLLDIKPEPPRRDVSPGAVAEISSRGVVIGTGNGTLRITTVQRPGRRPVAAAEFARGAGLEPGTVLR